MVAALQPLDADGRREPVSGDVLPRSELIARALQDQGGRREGLQVLRAKAFRLARRVERIPEAHEPAHSRLVGDHARDPAAERLAAGRDARSAAEPLDHLEPARAQHGLAIRRAALALAAPSRHVRELEADDANAALRQTASDAREEGRVHRRSRAVGEKERVARVLRAVDDRVALDSIQIKGPSTFAQRRMKFRDASRRDPIVTSSSELGHARPTDRERSSRKKEKR